MTCIYILLAFIGCLSSVSASQSPFPHCNKHFDEISVIRNEAGEFIFQAHKQGGPFFRSSYAFTAKEAAYDSVSRKRHYSQFSTIFHEFVSYSQPAGISILHEGHSKIAELFMKMYNKCIEEHSHLGARYERGKIYFDRGFYADCLSDIKPLVESGEWDYKEENILLVQGISQLETNLYDDAIDTLSEAINKNPKDKEVYFNRASAYFETGNFDESLKDYLMSGESKKLAKAKLLTSNEFYDALILGVTEGGQNAIVEFIPSLCESTYGLSQCLWTFVKEPIGSTIDFCNASYEVGETINEYIKALDQKEIEKLAGEIQQLYLNFDNLSEQEKGQAIGYCIGKYGVDIFAGGATLKFAGAIKKLRNANRIVNLETLTLETSQNALKAEAIAQAARRESFFTNVKIHHDKQNKHVLGKHNYESGKSIFEHEDPQCLLSKFAGKGESIKNRIVGMDDYRERVDFGEFIGYFISENYPELKIPTTKGTIRYSKKGAHIVPSDPNGW